MQYYSVRAKEATLKSLMSAKVQTNPLSKAIELLAPEQTYKAGSLNDESLVVGESYKAIHKQVRETIEKTQKKITALSGVITSASEEFTTYRINKANEGSVAAPSRASSRGSKSSDPVEQSDSIDDLLDHLSNSS